jgi:hypothetical protein
MIDGASEFAIHRVGVNAALDRDLREVVGLPSFLIVGPPRTGTTWLHGVLRNHAQLPSTIKETRFFDKYFHLGLAWYRSHYAKSIAGRRIGEIAPTYFASPVARERIARTIPQAKIVCIFRNPVERVLSLYRIKRAYGRIPWDFEEAIVHDPELRESSRYVSHFQAWRNVLGPAQVLGCVYDDLQSDPQSYMDRLTEFIGVPSFPLKASQIRHVESSDELTHPRSYYRTRGAILMADWLKVRRCGKLVATVKNSPMRRFLLGGGLPFAKVSREILHKLYETFRPEVEQLELLLNRDLSSWKLPKANFAAHP